MIELVHLLHIRKEEPISCLLYLLNDEVQDLSTKVWQRMQYDRELRAADLMRLERDKRIFVNPFLECLLEYDCEVRQIEVRLLVYSIRVENSGRNEARILCCRILVYD